MQKAELISAKIIFLFLVCCCLITFSKNSTIKFGYDTNYVKGYRKIITITPCTSTKLLKLYIKDGINNHNINYSPAPYTSLGVELDTRIWSLSFYPGFLSFNSNPSRYGKTYHYDSKLLLNLNPVIVYFNLQLYRGFYLKNTSDFKNEIPSVEFIKQPNLTTLTLGFNAYYIFNYKKFAFTAPYNYTSTQVKSCGSLVAGISYEYFNLLSDSGLVPTIIKDQFSNSVNILSGTSNYYTANIGYGYTFTIRKRFYISATYLAGVGLCDFKNNRVDSTQFANQNNLALQTNFRFGAGWDNGKWYTGINGILNDYYLHGLDQNAIEFDKFSFKIFVGKRFNTARIHNYIVDKIKKKAENYY